MSDESERENLLRRLIEGDRLALEQMLFSFHDRLLLHIRKKLPASLKTVVDADDILQQTYVAAFRNFGNFEPRSARAFYRWLATIAENQVLDAIKGQKRKKRGGDFKRLESRPSENYSSMANLLDVLSGGGRSPSMLAARAEGVRALQVAMAGLADDYREVIRLTCIEGKCPLQDRKCLRRLMPNVPRSRQQIFL